MFESDEAVTTGGIDTLAAALSRLDEHVDDGERIDQLTALERLKSAVAAAQARVTVGFVASQQQVAEGWREHAKACSDNGDFDGWRQARDNATRASLEEPEPGQNGSGGSGGGARSRRRQQLINGITAQVALARHESPHRGSQHVTVALTLSRHLPHVMTWLQTGVLSEWRATLIVRECSVLTPDLQETLDAELATTLGDGIGRLGDRQLTRHVKAIAYRLDPTSVLNRASQAENDRRVSLRPAPDTMAYLTALLPVAQAVAAYAALTHAADTAHASGDERGKGQVMADTLVERVTGQQKAEDVDVEVQVVITDDALFTDDDTPAQIPGYGTIPARWVRDLLTPEGVDADDEGGTEDQEPTASADPAAVLKTVDEQDAASCGPSGPAGPDTRRPAAATAAERQPATSASRDSTTASLGAHAQVWLRRLYTHPVTGQLVGMDSTRRVFDGNLRKYLLTRDAGTCRTPWCDAPIRHLDHITDHALSGPTTADNGQGLCVRCNHTKQTPGFTARTLVPDPAHPGVPHTVEVATPTGHTYQSTAPPLIPGKAPPATRTGPVIDLQPTTTPVSPFELYLTHRLAC